MWNHTGFQLLRAGVLLSALPIVLLLFALSISLDRGLLGWFLVVVVPLALYGVGVVVLLRRLGSSDGDSKSGTV